LKRKVNHYRFLADENFPVPAGKFLRSQRHNVKFVVEDSDLISLDDFNLLKFAGKEKRILLALDKDFRCNESLFKIISQGPGVILFSSADPGSNQLIKIIEKHLNQLTQNKVKGKVCRLSVTKVNCKTL